MGVDFISTNPEPTIDAIKTEQAALKVLLKEYATAHATYIDNKKTKNTQDTKPEVEAKKTAILTKINNIFTLINQVYPKGISIRGAIDRNASTLYTNINYLKNMIENDNLKNILSEVDKLEGNYDESQINVKTTFYNYLLYFIITIIVIGILIYIYSSAESGRLELVILVLGVCIFSYYCYDYLIKKYK